MEERFLSRLERYLLPTEIIPRIGGCMNNDLISRSALIAAIVEVRNTIPLRVPCAPYELLDDRPWAAGQNQRGGIRKALRCVNDAPAVDAVEVVRCKDCVRCGFCGDATNLEVMGFYGYCSRGKRREDG